MHTISGPKPDRIGTSAPKNNDSIFQLPVLATAMSKHQKVLPTERLQKK